MREKYFWKSVILFFLLFFLLAQTAQAQIRITNPLKYNNIQDLIEAVINFIFWLSIWIAPIMIIIAGFYFMTAQGDPAKITTAKQIILYTAIGLIVVISAKGLVQLFQQIFTVT